MLRPRFKFPYHVLLIFLNTHTKYISTRNSQKRFIRKNVSDFLIDLHLFSPLESVKKGENYFPDLLYIVYWKVLIFNTLIHSKVPPHSPYKRISLPPLYFHTVCNSGPNGGIQLHKRTLY